MKLLNTLVEMWPLFAIVAFMIFAISALGNELQDFNQNNTSEQYTLSSKK